MNLKDIFSMYKFKKGKKISNLKITILYRGLPNNKKIINGCDIKIYRNYFEYEENGEVKHIPFHRILEIRENGKLIYRKAKISKV